MTEEMNLLQQIMGRLNASNMLTAVLKTAGPIEIPLSELQGILKYQKPEDLVDLNAESTYVETFMDYIKENGGYVNVTIVDGDKFKLQLVSKEEGERTLGQIGDMGYVCTRARWNQYAHS
jgi:hypothetical protein